jgi:xanthine dehydrogenase accessory factor
MSSIFKALSKIQKNQDLVLAAIIETKGSTYRKTGAMMLIESDSTYWGLLSGGCLEGDIVLQSKDVFSEKEDKLIHYNMRDGDDLLWGMGLGCDGEITILLKYLPLEKYHFGFFEAFNKIILGSSCHMILSASLQNKSEDDNDVVISFDFNMHADHIVEMKKNSTNNQATTIFVESPHHLLICGGSPDIVPVIAIAVELGWRITVIDHRKDYAELSKFPKANQVLQIKRSEWKTFSLDDFDSAVVMSHQFEMDSIYLKYLLNSKVSYIGLLGPAKRRDKLLQACETDFEQQQGRVFGPVGLDIGAGTPETIALSIVSEIQAVKNNKTTNNAIRFCHQDESR